ncbi:MAG: dTDP-4-dehydrorhamnose reductase [Candidatus Dormibacteraeota bacterium]|nr:dTDP-4-dehydrorhamnose reductase [Candidatus Dormibacteraeota bacterium]
MRVLVLGAGGQLGRDLVPQLRAAGHEVLALARRDLDIAEEGALSGLLGRSHFDRVVNCAAYTNVDRAEAEPELAARCNFRGAALVAAACADSGVPLCHLSTDFVFGGDPPEGGRGWLESDPVSPLGVYATTKREGELACLAAGGPLYLVRTSWLYGTTGPNFPLAILRRAAAGEPLKVVADQVGSPTWTFDLARALTRLLELPPCGLVHLSGGGRTTWNRFAEELLRQAELGVTVRPVSTAEWGAPAPRPRFSVLESERWEELGLTPLRAWQEALREYLTSEPEVASILDRPG